MSEDFVQIFQKRIVEGVISTVSSQSGLNSIFNLKTNKGKLFVVLAEDVLVDDYKPIDEELNRLERKYWDNGTVIFIRILCKTPPEFVDIYEIKEFPTVLYIKDKVKVDQHTGLDPLPIEDIMKKYLTN